jgi:hypothetical protein
MPKIQLRVAAVFAIFGITFSCASPSRPKRFEEMIGWKFETIKPAYAFLLSYSEIIYVGRFDLVHGAKLLPKEVSRDYVGRSSRGLTIVDVLPSGTVMKVTGVYEAVSTIGDIVSFRCVLENGELAGRLVDLQFAQQNIDGENGGKPEIDPAFAKRVGSVVEQEKH